MKNKKVIIIGVIATLAVIGLGSSILISGNSKNKENQAVEQKSTETETESHAVVEEMTSITLEAELKAHEKEFTDAGYTLETEGLENKYSKLRRAGNSIELSIEKTIDYLNDLADADEALNKLGEDTSTEADKAKEVKETVKEEQKKAEETKDVYAGTTTNATSITNTTPAVAAPADTAPVNVPAQEQAASSTSGDIDGGYKAGDILPDGSKYYGSSGQVDGDAELAATIAEDGLTW